ncbi:hypothetical protein TcCL_ESM08760 [Trypanosoma cruzi]|nr:hypothetical protein TcCL_ESM08760 [Trypanosoma cruzi]
MCASLYGTFAIQSSTTRLTDASSTEKKQGAGLLIIGYRGVMGSPSGVTPCSMSSWTRSEQFSTAAAWASQKKNFKLSIKDVKHLMEYMIPHTTTNAIAGPTRLPASVGLARTNPPRILCQVEVTQTMRLDMRVRTFHSHRCVCVCVSENLTNTQAMPYNHTMAQIGNQHGKSCVHRKYNQSQTQSQTERTRHMHMENGTH